MCALASHIYRLYSGSPLFWTLLSLPQGQAWNFSCTSVLLSSFNKGLQGLDWRSRHLAVGKDSVAPSGLNITPMPSGTWILGVPALDTLGLHCSGSYPCFPWVLCLHTGAQSVYGEAEG